jgi:gamma-glutamyltranspeptidase
MIAVGGAREFYDGEIADKILKKLKSTPNNPSLMTASDLAGCRAIERSPVCVKVRSMNSGLHAIRIGDGLLSGAADPRREGAVRGD